MKKYLLPLCLVPALAWGQASFGHFDSIELEKMQTSRLKSADKNESEPESMTILMRIADDATAARVEAAGATIEQREGNILVVSVPMGLAEKVAATEGVVTVSLPQPMQLHEWTSPYGADYSRSTLGLDRIQSAAAPLPQAYTGEGVVFGIIDIGLNPQHIAFLNPDGTHRVKRVWYHVLNGKRVFTQTVDTEAKMAKFKTDTYQQTHGTHVMGIAAGGFVDAEGDGPDFRGAAPGTDIAMSCGVADNATLLKGLRSIVDYAKSEGKPCVINLSLGNNFGPHDGTDEFPAGLNEIAGEDGVTVCVSAGNEGADMAFLQHEFDSQATPLRSIINPTEYTAAVWPSFAMFPQAMGSMEIWSDDDTPVDIHFDIIKFGGAKPEVVTTFTLPSGGSGYIATKGMEPTSKVDVLEHDNEIFNSVFRGFIGGASEVYAGNNRYHAEINLQLECGDANSFQGYRMALRIEGQPGHKVYVYGIPVSSVFPFMFIGGWDGYTASDANGSINAMAGAENVITVGSYVTHNMTVANDVIGTTASYSSWGYTPDGRLHPMVSAPGSRIISAMSSEYVNGSAYNPDQISYYSYTAPDGTVYHWTPMSGTSMAAPYMAGIAAMWLSADPTLTTEDIVRIAQETAQKPTEPRYNDGKGAHVNAFAGLCKVLNISGINDVKVQDTPYSIERDGNIFTIGSPASQSISATMFNLQGAAVTTASTSGQILTIDASSVAPGIYILSVTTDGTIGSEKIIIK